MSTDASNTSTEAASPSGNRNIQVQQLYVSFIRVESFPVPSVIPEPCSEASSRYADEFRKAGTAQSNWTLPWLEKKRQYFWEFYLEQGDLQKFELPAREQNLEIWKQAWKHLMPLRSAPFVKVDVPSTPTTRVAVEGYWYPHCVAVVVTLCFKEDLPLNDMVRKVVRTRDEEFSVIWRKTGATSKELNLDNLAQSLIKSLIESVTGAKMVTTHGKPNSFPRTTATVIDARGVQSYNTAVQSGSPIHKALDGLCEWNAGFDAVPRYELEKASLHVGRDHRGLAAPQGHLLYATPFGRAVWFPKYFKENAGGGKMKIHTLSHYHSNLTLLSLQIDSLVSLVRRGKRDLLDKNGNIPGDIEPIFKNAVGNLRRLFGGPLGDTYTCYSAVHQILPQQAGIEEISKLYFPNGGLTLTRKQKSEEQQTSGNPPSQ